MYFFALGKKASLKKCRHWNSNPVRMEHGRQCNLDAMHTCTLYVEGGDLLYDTLRHKRGVHWTLTARFLEDWAKMWGSETQNLGLARALDTHLMFWNQDTNCQVILLIRTPHYSGQFTSQDTSLHIHTDTEVPLTHSLTHTHTHHTTHTNMCIH